VFILSFGLGEELNMIPGTPYHGEWIPTDKKFKVVKVQML
jgi:hypothetical protein